MKETEQTLFRKSNILHIRTNEGEFVVINPEILHEKTRWLAEKDTTEWGGDVEFETIAPHPECNKARECLQLTNGLNCSQAYDARTRSTSLCAKAYKLARLLPKEWGSDYKEFEGKDLHIVTPESSEPQEKYTCVDCGAEMGEGERKTFTVCETCWDKAYAKFKPKSAPSESQEDQEELWKEARHYIDVWRIEELFKRFKITRKPE